MQVNSDFTKRVVLHANDIAWIPSPLPGVDRRMLDRIGDEVARATSFVRYAPGSSFSRHTHGGGEEFIVLDGVFEDDKGKYPKGHYIRNPPTSAHTPATPLGCTIFVKLWQMAPTDRQSVDIDLEAAKVLPSERPGVGIVPLYDNEVEHVSLEHWEPGADVTVDCREGAELLVLSGGFLAEDGGETLKELSWMRIPAAGTLKATAGSSGARVWVKTGHLGKRLI